MVATTLMSKTTPYELLDCFTHDRDTRHFGMLFPTWPSLGGIDGCRVALACEAREFNLSSCRLSASALVHSGVEVDTPHFSPSSPPTLVGPCCAFPSTEQIQQPAVV